MKKGDSVKDLRNKVKDLRKIVSVFNFKDLDAMISNMINIGYDNIGNSALIKNFSYNDSVVTININLDSVNRDVESITAYEESEILSEIPQEILSLVEKDLRDSIK